MNLEQALSAGKVGSKKIFKLEDVVINLDNNIDLQNLSACFESRFSIIDFEAHSFADKEAFEVTILKCRIADRKCNFTEIGPIDLKSDEGISAFKHEIESIEINKEKIISHNINYDLRFLRKFLSNPDYSELFCSQNDIEWENYGYSSKSLEYLLFKCRFYYDSHNSRSDCLAVLFLLIMHPNELNKLGKGKTLIRLTYYTYEQCAQLKAMGYEVNLKTHKAKMSVDQNLYEAEIQNLIMLGFPQQAIR
jgi:hypothetical protein